MHAQVSVTVEFRKYSDTLLSCCLVSREWCLLAIYWLWKKPFHICPCQNGKLLIRTCLKFLSDDSIPRFYDDDTEQPPLFNYASFLQHLNFHEIYNAAWNYYNFWNVEDEYNPVTEEEKILFMEQDLNDIKYYEFDEQDNNYYEFDEEDDDDWTIEESDDYSQYEVESIEDFSQYEFEDLKDKILLLTSKLCQIFLLHSNKIISLNLCTSEMENGNVINEKWINIFKLENASSALANIKKFVSGGLYDLQSIINIMINICHDIEILEIIFEDDNFKYSFSNLIKNQKKLKELNIIGMNKYNFNEMIDFLSYQSYSLRILHFEGCIFKNGIPFKEMSLLQNLELLTLINCDIVDIPRKNLDYSFPSLKKLYFDTDFDTNLDTYLNLYRNFDTNLDMRIPCTKEIEKLISCSSNLEKIILFGSKIRLSNIFNIIANGCSNIKILDIQVDKHYIESIIPIFIQCQQLESISLQLDILNNRQEINESMTILAKNIPKSLSMLKLMISIEIDDLKAFFSQFDGLLKVFGFGFNYCYSYDDLDIEIKKYAEKKRITYRIVNNESCNYYYIEFDI
ncbi:hypothetical protein RclHR1_01670007 [Rhizophagus clarus]|uniref:F-box domain-containing protein n=1 Tax=Rhizophagus clarus TaxID=94130 RepID=A0A2Z6RAV9_9GLOM|nr:hypothetical protein RclHR1_01670007 [Rhizophagus clarus]